MSPFVHAVELSESSNFSTGFEVEEGYTPGYLQSDPIWNIDGSSYPLIGAFGVSGSQGLDLDQNGALSIDFTSESLSTVGWIDFYVKPAFGSSAALPVNIPLGQAILSGFVKVGSDGAVYALHGDGQGGGTWMDTGYRVALAAGAGAGDVAADWLRMTYRLDYTNHQWDIYLDEELQMVDLGFIDASVVPFVGFNFQGSSFGPTLFDQFEAGLVNPLFTDADNDGIADAYELAQGMSTTVDDRNEDADFDTLLNIFEYMSGLEAGNPDSDGDGVHDGAESANGGDPSVFESYILEAVPFLDDFEAWVIGALSGQGLWQINGGIAEVQSLETYEGGQALAIRGSETTPLELFNLFDGSDVSVAWIEFFVQPVRFTDFDLALASFDAPSTAAFFFVGEERIAVLDGDGDGSGTWQSYPIEPAASLWERVVVQKDYATQQFSLWVNGSLVASNLGFTQRQPYFNRFEIQQISESNAYLDRLSIGAQKPLELDSDGDGLFDEVEDLNGNGLVDAGETDPLLADSDGDGLEDGAAVTLRLWLKANAGVELDATGAVTAWRDQSSYQEDATQSNPEFRPSVSANSYNGQPAIAFDGSDDYLEALSSFDASAEDFTLFVVQRKTGGHDKSAAFSYSTTNSAFGAPLLRWGPEANQLGINAVGYGADGVYLDLGSDHPDKLYITSVRRSGGVDGLNADLTVRALTHHEGAESTGLQSWSSGASQGYFVGKKKSDNDHMFGGDIVEILVYQGALDEAQYRSIEEQLGARYGLELDRDADRLPDVWELATFGSVDLFTAEDDPDGDGVINFREYNLGTDASVAEQFDPIQGDAGLRLWLNAELGAELDEAGQVERLLDLSGWGDHAVQSDPAKRPSLLPAAYGGLATVALDGSDDFMLGQSHFDASAGDFTLIAVTRQAAGNGLSATLSYSTSDEALGAPLLRWNRPDSGDVGINDVGRSVAGSFVSLGESAETAFQLVSISRSGGEVGGLNGQLQVRALSDLQTLENTMLQSWESGSSDAYSLGRKKTTVSGNNDLFHGEIAEIIVFDRALTSEELREIEMLLGAKYAIALDLDADGLADADELNYFGSLDQLPEGDFDVDGLSNERELALGMNPGLTDALGPVLGHSDLALWLRADWGILADASGKVQRWEDHSGYGRSVEQASTSAQPVIAEDRINGLPSVVLDGVDDYLLGDAGFSPADGEWTLFVVHRKTGGHENAATLSFNQPAAATGAPLLRWGPDANHLGMNDVGVSAEGVYADLGSSTADAFVVSSVMRALPEEGESGAPVLSLINESYFGRYANAGEQTWLSAESSVYALGRKTASSTHFFGGDIAEVILFHSALSYQQRLDVSDYLTAKYRLSRDIDGDGLFNIEEDANLNGLVDSGETDPDLEDSDGDGISDGLALTWQADPVADALSLATQPDGSVAATIDFEIGEGYTAGPLGGQNGWEAAPVFRISEAAASSGSQSLAARAHPYTGEYTSAQHYLDAGGESVVWITFFANLQPVQLAAVPIPEDGVGVLFALSEPGIIAAYDATAADWAFASIPGEEPAPEWIRYDIRLDYTQKTWSLCLEGTPVLHELPFIDPNRAALSRFILLQEGAAANRNWIDAITIANRPAAGFDFDADGLDNSTEWQLGSDALLADTDGDGMSDLLESTYQFDLLVDDALEDLDGDLLPNLSELLRGSDPSNPDENGDAVLDGVSIPGQVSMKQWEIPGARAISFIETDLLYADSVLTELRWDPGLIFHDFAMGSHVQGYLTAPVSGEYRIWLYGDDVVEFWLSPDASSTQAERIVYAPNFSFVDNFEQYAGQSSLPIQLEAGEKYYFEIFQYGNSTNGYFGIAWQYGQMLEPEIIGSEHIASFTYDPEDVDGDGLLDSDEVLFHLDPRDRLGLMGRFGDGDSDRFQNHWELAHGLNPSEADAYPAQSRSALFPEVADPDSLSLTNWSLNRVGWLQHYEAFEAGDSLYLAAGGANSGQYAYAYQEVAAPLRASAKVAFTYVEDTRAEAALMLRASLAPDAAFYRISFAPDGRIISEQRQEAGERSVILAYGQPDPHAEVWLQAEYDGSHVSAAYSYDQQQWFQLDRVKLDLGELPVAGFAATSFDFLETIGVAFEEVILDRDSDGDGLWDLEEAALGTDPALQDTDGDGQSDAEEVHALQTDPLVPDHLLASAPVQSLGGQSGTVLEGSWRTDGESLYSLDYRGAVEFALTIPADGYYRLEVSVREASPYRAQSEFELNGQLGSQPIGRQVAQASNAASTTMSYWLPWTLAGSTQLVLDWVNVQHGSSLQVDRVELIPLVFESGEAQQTWETQRIAHEFALDSAPLSSPTSPWNLYGTARDLDLLVLTADSSPQPILAERALSQTFHADIPLQPSQAATTVDLSYANGLASEQQQVQWGLTNLAQAQDLIIRRGDSLLLAWRDALEQEAAQGVYIEVFEVLGFDEALPSDTARQTYYSLAADTSASASLADFLAAGLTDPYDATAAQVHSYQSGALRAFTNPNRAYVDHASAPSDAVVLIDAFGLGLGEVATLALDSYGQFVVRASWRDAAGLEAESMLTVDVPEIELGSPLTVSTGYSRKWQPEQLSEQAVLQQDDSIYLTELAEVAPRTFRLLTDSPEKAYLLALVAEGGAVADTTALHPIVDYSGGFGGSLKVLDTFSDGTQMVEFIIALGGDLPEDFSILLQPLKAGVVFDDGTLQRVITRDDLDELGRYHYRMLLPADVPGSACHYYEFQQAGGSIGKKI